MVHRAAPFPQDEIFRIDKLEQLGLLDTLPELAYNDIVLLATTICRAPIGLISLVDRERQWFKACIGLDVAQTPRDYAFCAHAILQPDALMIVEDALLDARFMESPLVLGAPFIRFYAGAPIVTHDGHALGTVCIIDTVPRTLDAGQQAALKALARQTAGLLELREMTMRQTSLAQDLERKITHALADDDAVHASFRQDRRVAAIGQLTSGVAHDFNNLLQGISFGLQLVQRRAEFPEDVVRHAKSALKSVTRGAELIAQLLAFSRDQPSDTGVLSPAIQIEQMKDMLIRVLGPEMHLAFSLADGATQVLCNGTQLEAAVLNLVINARDAMSNIGSISIASELRHLRDDDDLADGAYLALTFEDNGPGIDPAVLKRVFEPFFTTKLEGKGTGLGLAQVYGVAARAGGIARIHSVPGQGTTVTMLLKAVQGDDMTPGAPLASPHEPLVSSGAKILLVDDDDTLRELLQALLSASGYRVHAVGTGFAAIQHLQHDTPDIVVTDCAMRGLSGAKLARVIGEIRPDIPVVFMSGYADIEQLRQQLDDDSILLQKPVPVDLLIGHLERLIAR